MPITWAAVPARRGVPDLSAAAVSDLPAAAGPMPDLSVAAAAMFA
ncbi:MAG TPA: hypothetical protein VGR26_10005 [Acidimicrobiales bacterium]|nr:hypothetical protein [Acidimicrobiales bacterium]